MFIYDFLMLDGKRFWAVVDSVTPYKRLADFAKATGMAYNTVRQQRVDGTLPKAEDLYNISKALHRSMEFLLTGKDESAYSQRVDKIAWHCQNIASDDDLFLIEKILGIRSDFKVVPKEEPAAEKTTSRSTIA